MDMNKKDNVYEDTTLTGDKKVEKVVAAEGVQTGNASAVLGKFRNVDALAQAYNALQAEFTRRSQRLKELERERENLKAGIENAEHLGVEKLRKNAMARKADEKRFDVFVADVFADKNVDKKAVDVDGFADMDVEVKTETDAETAAEMGAERPLDVRVQTSEREVERETEKDTQNQGALEKDEPVKVFEKDELAGEVQTSMTKVGKKEQTMEELKNQAEMGLKEGAIGSVANNGVPELSSEMLYEKVLQDEGVRLRVIGEYLSSIGKSGAPVTFGNAGILAAPPMRAKSISDAGGMALQYFKNK